MTGTLQQAPAWIVDEVNALSRAGKLREGVSFDDACALAEMILVDGCRWGDYYGARRSAAPRLAKRRKRVAHEIDALTGRLASLRAKHGRWLWSHAKSAAPSDHPLSRPSVATLLNDTAALCARYTKLSAALAEPLPIRGRGNDPWLMGFVWVAAVGWREMTTAPISPRGHFARFLAHALEERINEATEHVELESLIKTAIERFQLNGKKPLRPGDEIHGVGVS